MFARAARTDPGNVIEDLRSVGDASLGQIGGAAKGGVASGNAHRRQPGVLHILSSIDDAGERLAVVLEDAGRVQTDVLNRNESLIARVAETELIQQPGS